jgi:hypothetical protein
MGLGSSSPKYVDGDKLTINVAPKFFGEKDGEPVEVSLSRVDLSKAHKLMTNLKSSFWKKEYSYIFGEVGSRSESHVVFKFKISSLAMQKGMLVIKGVLQKIPKKSFCYVTRSGGKRKNIEVCDKNPSPAREYMYASDFKEHFKEGIVKACMAGAPVMITRAASLRFSNSSVSVQKDS